VRFIGDRSIREKDFGRIQIDRIAEMQKWAENIKNVQSHTIADLIDSKKIKTILTDMFTSLLQ
jgi:hypothetical protein